MFKNKIEKGCSQLNDEIKGLLIILEEENSKKLHTEDKDDVDMSYLKPSFKMFSTDFCKNLVSFDCNFYIFNKIKKL